MKEGCAGGGGRDPVCRKEGGEIVSFYCPTLMTAFPPRINDEAA